MSIRTSLLVRIDGCCHCLCTHRLTDPHPLISPFVNRQRSWPSPSLTARDQRNYGSDRPAGVPDADARRSASRHPAGTRQGGRRARHRRRHAWRGTRAGRGRGRCSCRGANRARGVVRHLAVGRQQGHRQGGSGCSFRRRPATWPASCRLRSCRACCRLVRPACDRKAAAAVLRDSQHGTRHRAVGVGTTAAGTRTV